MPAASKRLLVCYVGSAMTVGRSSGLCCELDDSTLDPDLPLCQSSGRYCSGLRFQNSFKSSASCRASSFLDLFPSLLYHGHLL
ncbi:hypothetical protein NEUTE2DRAFT_130575 [Neurospora tetrasperma FGSC 2509]|nr:hypothetical protein NEUTE2DRAFT_130575 [Neurospora tetrasperma FGSC 2509]